MGSTTADRHRHTAGVVGELERGALVISIDVEMAWGQIHRPGVEYRYPAERDHLDRLLDVLDHYEVPATWAFVGHLLLDGCDAVDGRPHPELVRPTYDWFAQDWLGADPCTDVTRAPTWYAPDLLESIRRRTVAHEIGSHSFTHLIAGDPGCSEASFRSDLRLCRATAELRREPLTSFVFPRNQYGHEHVLAEEGFTCYRGARHDPFSKGTPLERRVRRLVDSVAPSAATAVRPMHEGDIWNLPATYLHDVGSRRRYRVRLAQARRRLRQAVEQRSLFHLWFHPHNLGHETERWFAGFETLLGQAVAHRSKGRLDTLTMAGVVERVGLSDGAE